MTTRSSSNTGITAFVLEVQGAPVEGRPKRSAGLVGDAARGVIIATRHGLEDEHRHLQPYAYVKWEKGEHRADLIHALPDQDVVFLRLTTEASRRALQAFLREQARIKKVKFLHRQVKKGATVQLYGYPGGAFFTTPGVVSSGDEEDSGIDIRPAQAPPCGTLKGFSGGIATRIGRGRERILGIVVDAAERYGTLGVIPYRQFRTELGRVLKAYSPDAPHVGIITARQRLALVEVLLLVAGAVWWAGPATLIGLQNPPGMTVDGVVVPPLPQPPTPVPAPQSKVAQQGTPPSPEPTPQPSVPQPGINTLPPPSPPPVLLPVAEVVEPPRPLPQAQAPAPKQQAPGSKSARPPKAPINTATISFTPRSGEQPGMPPLKPPARLPSKERKAPPTPQLASLPTPAVDPQPPPAPGPLQFQRQVGRVTMQTKVVTPQGYEQLSYEIEARMQEWLNGMTASSSPFLAALPGAALDLRLTLRDSPSSCSPATPTAAGVMAFLERRLSENSWALVAEGAGCGWDRSKAIREIFCQLRPPGVQPPQCGDNVPIRKAWDLVLARLEPGQR